MPVKHFIIDPSIKHRSKEEINASREEREKIYDADYDRKQETVKNQLAQDCALKHVPGRIVVMCDIEGKNWHRMANGVNLRLERNWNNLNNREVKPVNCIVVDAEYIPKGAEIVVHHNAVHEVNKIYNYTPLNGESAGSDVQYFSLNESECFLWRMPGEEWQPMKGFALAYRVFEIYSGLIAGIEPKKMADILYIRTGLYANKVVHTLKSSDYCMILQGADGREQQIIRCRDEDNEETKRESEIIAIRHDLTEKVNSGELLVGIEPNNAKKIDEWSI